MDFHATEGRRISGVAMNRLQFRPGLSMAEFMGRFGMEGQFEDAVCASRWPDGFACPRCGISQPSSFRREGRLYFQCTACRHQCSVISDTIFEATKLPFEALVLDHASADAVQEQRRGAGAEELMRHLGVSSRSAWLMRQ